jgi:hypothetical protein
MSVPTVRRPHLGPKIRLLRTPPDRRVQIKRLVVWMRAIVKPVG